MPQPLDVLRIHPNDNVCVATRPLPAGTQISCGDVNFVLDSDANLGAKLALRSLSAGDRILKFGEAIGSLTEAVSVGAHIHTHNLKSDYIHTHSRGELINLPQSGQQS